MSFTVDCRPAQRSTTMSCFPRPGWGGEEGAWSQASCRSLTLYPSPTIYLTGGALSSMRKIRVHAMHGSKTGRAMYRIG